MTARCCIACGHVYTGPLACPMCREPGEPVNADTANDAEPDCPISSPCGRVPGVVGDSRAVTEEAYPSIFSTIFSRPRAVGWA